MTPGANLNGESRSLRAGSSGNDYSVQASTGLSGSVREHAPLDEIGSRVPSLYDYSVPHQGIH